MRLRHIRKLMAVILYSSSQLGKDTQFVLVFGNVLKQPTGISELRLVGYEPLAKDSIAVR